jgi:hypothetical protein
MTAVYLPDTIVQEIPILLCLQCAKVVYNDLASGGKHDTQENLYAKVYHGSTTEDGYVSIANQFISGKTPFDQCFLNTDIEINRIGNENRIDGTMLERKELFHCDPAARHVVNEGGFDCRALTHIKDVEVSVRNINDKASKAQAAFKHALKHYNDWSHMKDSVPSGQTIKDMALYIQMKLFLRFGGSKILKRSRRSKVKALTEDDMLSKWFFTGYFAYLLFCPIGLLGRSLSVVFADGKNVQKESWLANRKKVAKIKVVETTTAAKVDRSPKTITEA